MLKKLYDLCAVNGTYEKNGETKNRYVNVGAIMEKEDGGRFIFLERSFNPAGIPNPDNRTNIILSMFKKENGNQGQENNNNFNSDDDIPF